MQATAQAALSSRKAHFHKYVGHDPDTSVTEGHVEAIAWDGRAVAKYQRLEAKHKRLGWVSKKYLSRLLMLIPLSLMEIARNGRRNALDLHAR